MRHFLATAAALAFMASGAQAFQVSPTSYDMLNGQTGSYQYWDESYSGSGNPFASLSPLSGGLGDLTDGAIATQNWNVTEQPPGPGPYVGWSTIDPTITFHFAGTPLITRVVLYWDDSDGAGGVNDPNSVTIDGTNYTVVDPPGPDPFAFTVAGLNLTKSSFDITIQRNGWIMLSEVEFYDDVSTDPNEIPLPASVALLGAGVVALGAYGRLRKRA